MKDYGYLLKDDPAYAVKAARVAELARDVAEVLSAEMVPLKALLAKGRAGRTPRRIAFHAPCSLQHGRIRGVVENLLVAAGLELTAVRDAHLCCGSAGTYSLLQPDLAGRLRDDKLAALEAGGGECIVSANVGCIEHLSAGAVYAYTTLD